MRIVALLSVDQLKADSSKHRKLLIVSFNCLLLLILFYLISVTFLEPLISVRRLLLIRFSVLSPCNKETTLSSDLSNHSIRSAPV